MFTTKQLVALLVSLLVVGSLAGVAAAQQGPSAGGAVVVDEGETVDGDLDAVGGTVVVAGTVTGDVSATAGTVLVTETGVVNGNLDAVAGSATLEGSVGGSPRPSSPGRRSSSASSKARSSPAGWSRATGSSPTSSSARLSSSSPPASPAA